MRNRAECGPQQRRVPGLPRCHGGRVPRDKLQEAGGKIEVLPLDLAKQSSIQSFVGKFCARAFPPLAGLVSNAGGKSVAAPTRTAEGIETIFGVNHLGHYLLARLMLPDLAQGARITFMASNVHDPKQKTGLPAPRYENAETLAHDFEPGAEAGKRRYATSKLCNIYTTYELVRHLAASPDWRLQSVRVNAFDPGTMPGTGLAETYSPVMRFAWHYVLPALTLFEPNVNTPNRADVRRNSPPDRKGTPLGNTSLMVMRPGLQTLHSTWRGRWSFGTAVPI